VSDSFAEQDSTGDKGTTHRAVRHGTKKQTNMGDLARRVDSNRHSINVNHWHPTANAFQIRLAQPGRISLSDVRHDGSFAPLHRVNGDHPHRVTGDRRGRPRTPALAG